MSHRTLAVSLSLFLAATVAADTKVIDRTVTGTPKLQSIDVIRFGPGGVLFVGDARGGQVLAVEIGGAAGKPGFSAAIPDLAGKLAARLGAPAKGIEIVDFAVHPVTHTAVVAVRLHKDRRSLLLTVDGAGKVGELPLENVPYARVRLLTQNKAALSRLTDLAWAGDRLLVAGLASEEFGSKIFTVPGPISHDSAAACYSTETFHVAHRRWETKAPMTALMPYEEGGKKYLAGSFACTPVVKYPLDGLEAGATVKGISMIEMGSGNRPITMLSYDKDGKGYVLMNTHRFHHARKAFGPSPYWTVRFERELLRGDNVNEKATWRINGKYEPVTERITLVPAFHGVVHMDRLGADRVLTLKEDGKGALSLVALPLP